VQQRLAVIAEQIQENERLAARRRLLESARRHNVGHHWPDNPGGSDGAGSDGAGSDREGWNATTRPLPFVDRPLMTLGQAYRTRHTLRAA
jgi:hypothetical protein